MTIFISSNYGFIEESIIKMVYCCQPHNVQIKVVTDDMGFIRCISSVAANPITDTFCSALENTVSFTELRNTSES